MFYVYVLQSEKDNKFYTGYTKNLKLRFDQHCQRKVKSRANRQPLILVYYEACLSQQDATHREKYFKTYHENVYKKKNQILFNRVNPQ